MWLLFLIPTVYCTFFHMTNLETVSPTCRDTRGSFTKIFGLLGTAAAGNFLGVIAIIIGVFVPDVSWLVWITLPFCIIGTLYLLKNYSPEVVRPDVEKQFEILYLKQTWVMTIIYTMTFGSFIGFANAFPGLIKV